MSNKFTFDIGEALANKLLDLSDIIVDKNELMQQQYNDLAESFRDPVYLEFQSDFNECNRSIKEATEALKELAGSILKYSASLRDIM